MKRNPLPLRNSALLAAVALGVWCAARPVPAQDLQPPRPIPVPPGGPTRQNLEQAGWQLLQAGPDSRTWGRVGAWTNAPGAASLRTTS